MSIFLSSGIFVSSEGSGNGGKMEINVHEITLGEGSQIASNSWEEGDGGSVVIKADSLTASGIGDFYGDKSASGIFGTSESSEPKAGKAGSLLVQANTIRLTDDAKISTSVANSASGAIAVTTSNLLYLRNRGAITTDVKSGEGNGGNITIAQPTFVVLDQASIISKVKRGYGGDIRVDSQQYLASAGKENILNASSDILERSGQIVITAPTKDLGVERVALPTRFFHNALKPRCQSRDVEKIPSFSIRGCWHPPPARMRGSLMKEDWERLGGFRRK